MMQENFLRNSHINDDATKLFSISFPKSSFIFPNLKWRECLPHFWTRQDLEIKIPKYLRVISIPRKVNYKRFLIFQLSFYNMSHFHRRISEF